MNKKDILKELEKLGVKFKPTDLKEKLEGKLKRAQKKAEKLAAKKPKKPVEPEIDKEPEVEVKVKVSKPVVKIKRKILVARGSGKEIWKVTDIETPQGPMKRVHFYGHIEVWEPGYFKTHTHTKEV